MLHVFSFQKPFSTLYYKASNLLGRFDFVSKNIFLVGPRGVQCEINLKEIMDWESFDVVRFDLGPPPSRSNKDTQT